MTEFLGYLAAVLTTISFVPQAYKMIKTKDTSSISFVMYLLFSIGVFSWIIYGFLVQSTPIILANIVTFILAVIILTLKIKHK